MIFKTFFVNCLFPITSTPIASWSPPSHFGSRRVSNMSDFVAGRKKCKNGSQNSAYLLTFLLVKVSQNQRSWLFGFERKKMKKIASLFSLGSCFTKRYKYHMLFLPFSLWIRIKFQQSSCFKIHSCGDDRKLLDWAFRLAWVIASPQWASADGCLWFSSKKIGNLFGGDVCPSLYMVMSQNTGALAFRKQDTVRGACAPTRCGPRLWTTLERGDKWKSSLNCYSVGQQAGILFGIAALTWTLQYL